MKPLNEVVQNTPPSGIRRFFDIAQSMEGVISLGVGEPDYVTPWRVRESGIWSLEHGYTTYTSNAGLLELRQAISKKLNSLYQLDYDPDKQILITVGVSEGLDLALRALLNQGDEVIVPDPCYVSYVPCIQFAGGVPVRVPSYSEEEFRLDPERMERAITSKTKAILLCYPANPTGATQTRENLRKIVTVAAAHDLYLISDEIYDRLSFTRPHTSIPALTGAWDRTVLLNGFSKAYAMTGWRIGYACGPSPIIEAMTKIHQYTMLCASHLAQRAALEAINGGEEDVQAMVADYDRRRRYFVRGLNSAGLDCQEPSGAFYAFPSIRHTGLSSLEYAEALLMKERVAVVPGNAFGDCGEGHIRCSYATSLDNLEEAIDRIRRFNDQLGGHRLEKTGAALP